MKTPQELAIMQKAFLAQSNKLDGELKRAEAVKQVSAKAGTILKATQAALKGVPD